MGDAIRWVARKLGEVADSIEKVTEAAVEVLEEVVQRAAENPVVKTVMNGFRTAKKVADVKEVLDTIRRTVVWLWAFAMGQACSSIAAPFCATFPVGVFLVQCTSVCLPQARYLLCS